MTYLYGAQSWYALNFNFYSLLSRPASKFETNSSWNFSSYPVSIVLALSRVEDIAASAYQADRSWTRFGIFAPVEKVVLPNPGKQDGRSTAVHANAICDREQWGQIRLSSTWKALKDKWRSLGMPHALSCEHGLLGSASQQ